MDTLQLLIHSLDRYEAITNKVALAFMYESSYRHRFSFLLGREREWNDWIRW